jgi:membrane protein
MADRSPFRSEFGPPAIGPVPPTPRERRRGGKDIGKTALARMWYRLYNEELPLLAAGVALFSILSLMPALASIVSIYGLVSSPADIAGQIAPLERFVPPEVFDVIASQLRAAAEAPSPALGLAFATSLALALFGAIGGLRALMTAINIAHNRADTRSFVRRMLIAIALGVGAIVGAAIAVGLLVLLPGAMRLLRIEADTALVVNALRWPALFVLVMGSLAVVYRFAPVNPTHRSWPGCVAATLLWMLSSYGLSVYVDRVADYNGLYGAFGGVMVLVLWFYVISFVVVLGAGSRRPRGRRRLALPGRDDRGGQRRGELVVLERRQLDPTEVADLAVRERRGRAGAGTTMPRGLTSPAPAARPTLARRLPERAYPVAVAVRRERRQWWLRLRRRSRPRSAFRTVPSPPGSRPSSGEGGGHQPVELRQLEGLPQVAEGAARAAGGEGVLGEEAGRDQDRERGRDPPQRAGGGDTVHAGHLHVADRQIDALCPRDPKPVVAAGGSDHLVAAQGQGEHEHLADVRLVVDDQDDRPRVLHGALPAGDSSGSQTWIVVPAPAVVSTSITPTGLLSRSDRGAWLVSRSPMLHRSVPILPPVLMAPRPSASSLDQSIPPFK